MSKNLNFIYKQINKMRVDIFINKNEDTLSRSSIKKLIEDKKLKVNGKIISNASYKLKYEDKIFFEIPKLKELNLNPYDYKLNIIYEDQDIIIIDKPAGISMHPGAGNFDKTIVNALINYNNYLSNIGNKLRPGIVHRLDKDTSGLIIIAKNNKSHEKLSNQFSQHTVSRIYLALVWGKVRPRIGKIETLITRSLKNRQMMEVGFSKGKKAITNYKTLEIFENNNTPTFSLVEFKLETGRTHQIRVHMSYKGNNILGDKKYGKKFKKFKNIDSNLEKLILNLDRQFLHAKVLGFHHPLTGERLEFSSNLPKNLYNILKKLRNTNK